LPTRCQNVNFVIIKFKKILIIILVIILLQFLNF